MSVSKWAYTPWKCDGQPCPGDCDHCSFDPDDYISRADAIEAVRKKLQDWGSYAFEDYRRGLYEAQDIIEALPSADAEQGWIPCSERLPSESGDYLCTIPLDADETYTEVLMFHKGRFYEDDAEWGATYHDDVLAWMPLPTPYKGGDDTE